MAESLAAPGPAVVAFALLALCWLGGLLASGPVLSRAFRGAGDPRKAAVPGRRGLLLMAAMTVLHLLLVKPRLPHTVWHEHHAGAALEAVMTGPWESAGVTLHGPAFPAAMRALSVLVPGRRSVFTLNYLVSLASAWLLFLLVCVLTGETSPGVAAAAVLLSLPARLRLSVTETEFVLVEALSLACLLLFALWKREPRDRLFCLGLGCLAMLAQTRAEMLVLGPILLAVYLAFLRRGLPPVPLRSPGVWAAAVLGGLLCAPRALQIRSWGGERTGRFLMDPSALAGSGWKTLNVFLDPAWTPAAYMGLALIGAAFLLRSRLSPALALLFHLALLSQFYFPHVDCVSLATRTGLATQYLLAGLAAYGGWSLVKSLPEQWAGAGAAALAVLILVSPLPYAGVLTKLYVSQQEFAILRRAAPALPEGAVVALLSREEAEFRARTFGPTSNAEKLLTLTAGKPVRAMGLARFLAEGQGPAFFFAGADCYTPLSADARAAGSAPGGVYRHPLCSAMAEKFILAPVAGETVKGESLSPEPMADAGGFVGFFRVEGLRKDPRPRRRSDQGRIAPK